MQALQSSVKVATSRAANVKDQLHHVAVAVDDIQAAVTWYTTTFNCSIEYQDASWALLAFDNVKLALVLPNQHPPHICISRPDADSFGKLKLHRDGTRSVYIKDPNGNSVEVIEQQ